jgi:hypothetical protein
VESAHHKFAYLELVTTQERQILVPPECLTQTTMCMYMEELDLYWRAWQTQCAVQSRCVLQRL